MTRHQIAEALDEIAVLLELKGENPFKVRAYQSGARVLETLAEPLDQLITEGRLADVRGIGDALSQKIQELHATSKLEFLEKLRASVPPGLLALLEIPGVGPKKVRALNEKLGVVDIASLVEVCKAGRVAELAGFGEKTQAKILQGIANREAYARRHLWWDAAAIAEPLLVGLRALPQVIRAESAGSLRRGLETVGDLDFIVAASDVAAVMEWFCTRPSVREITGRGETKASVRFENGLQADLRVVPEAQFVFALHHFTGSKQHNVLMRQRALERGLSMSEWGFFRADSSTQGHAGSPSVIPAKTEEDLFRALDLSFIPPELREGIGEIEAAEKNALPELVRFEELRGAFHNHTTESDGRNTLEEMAAAATALGWQYLGIADHSKSSIQAHGLDEERLLAQVAAIRALNASGRFSCHIFAGSEVDILPDGRLDFSHEILAQLDYTVASVHSAFSQSEIEMTQRIVRAIETPGVTMLGHLTGRLLLRREAYAVDAARVIDAAAANGVVIEINANPWRLDMDWRSWRRAAERGVLACINPDAHETDGLSHLRAGIFTARKGWLTAANVLNTRSLRDVTAFLQARKK